MEPHQEKFKQKLDSPAIGAEEHYCPICGKETLDPALKRFGGYFCSEAHVAEYAREIRTRASEVAAVTAEGSSAEAQTQPRKGGLWNLLKLGACCAAPILAVVILLPLLQGGTTGLAAIGGNLLYFAAILACPLGMYFMMRGMQRMQHGEKEEGHEKSGAPKALQPDRNDPARQ